MNTFPARKLPVAVVFLVAPLMLASGRATAQPHQPVIGYLGFLECNQTTSGGLGDLARGNDQLGAAYGVFVSYTDGSYRAWGDMLYQGEVNDRWKLAPRLDIPLFIYRPDPPSLSTEIDITSPGKSVRYVRVAIVLFDNDYPINPPLTKLETGGTGKVGVITRGLRNEKWTNHMRELDSDERTTIFSDRVFRAARDNNSADKIGINEYKFTATQLENPERFTQISSAAELAARRTSRPGRDVSYHFTDSGTDSLYTGSLWLVKGPRTEMEQILSWAGPEIVFKRFTRWVYVGLANRKEEPVRFSLKPTGPVKRVDETVLVDGVERTRVDPVSGLPFYSIRRTLADELAPGQFRVYALESPEDELFFYFDAPPKPAEGQFGVLDPQPTVRLRHGDSYIITSSGDAQSTDVFWWNEIPREYLPAEVWRELHSPETRTLRGKLSWP